MSLNGNPRSNPEFHLRPYKGKELRDMYGVSRKTFNTWLNPIREQIGKRLGHYYNVEQVRIIIDFLGIPGIIDLE